MAIERVFAGWDRPGLKAAVDLLSESRLSCGTFDLEGCVIVVPGSRAGRRLTEMLVEAADQRNVALFPPEIVTQGRLPEKLYKAQKPFADDLTQQVAWMRAIQSVDRETVGDLFAKTPQEGDLQAWLHLGHMLSRLHRELAAEGLDFAAVRDSGAQLTGFSETGRWTALVQIQRAYLKILNELDLWDMQTARLFAIEHHECATRAEILLLGTADMNRVLRLMLDQVQDRVKAIVFAPEALESRFDEYGCIVPEAWLDADPGLSMDSLKIADDPSDQAACVLKEISALNSRYPAAEVAIGVSDETLVPLLGQYLEQNRIAARYGKGTPFTRSGPYQVLQQVAGYLDGRSFAAFAALVRLPAVQDWIEHQGVQGDWLSEMDRFQTAHLPQALDRAWPEAAKIFTLLIEVRACINALLEPLGKDTRGLRTWCEPLSNLLIQLFGNEPLDRSKTADRQVLSVCEAILSEFRLYRNMPPRLEPGLTGAEALRLTLSRIRGEFVPPPAIPDAVEMLGWLELPLDDAPVLIVTGFNEGKVPASRNADLFLPNQIRRELKIEDNDRRFARDAYALSMLAASRAELRILFGRRDRDGDPLYPSRLLFAGDAVLAAQRARSFFAAPSSGSTVSRLLHGMPRPGRSVSDLVPARPKPLPGPIPSMRITEFSDYVACPYRYYLKHRLRLAPLDDDAEEIRAPEFGSLAHHVLQRFGRDPVAASSDGKKIRSCLDALLDESVLRVYGADSLAVVGVQVEQLRMRLHAFARWQADHAASGWKIEFVEASPPPGRAVLMVDSIPMELSGRIDRIDFHPQSGERIIFDYKTSDTPKPPEKTHRTRDGWINFQLPLYRHLARAMGIKGPCRLGYIVLPKDTDKVNAQIAPWSEEELDEADLAAADVVRRIRNEEFWPPSENLNPDWDDFAAICMTRDSLQRDSQVRGGER
ncbi:MAG: PD-(D/E)XK nuclease family protein [Planctomycetota bacterium]